MLFLSCQFENIFRYDAIKCAYPRISLCSSKALVSPKYEKFKTAPLLKIIPTRHKDWKHLRLEYKRSHNGRELKSISRRGDVKAPVDLRCPCCGAPFQYLYRNNGSKGQHQCKVCGELFPRAKQDLVKNTISDVPSAVVP